MVGMKSGVKNKKIFFLRFVLSNSRYYVGFFLRYLLLMPHDRKQKKRV